MAKAKKAAKSKPQEPQAGSGLAVMVAPDGSEILVDPRSESWRLFLLQGYKPKA